MRQVALSTYKPFAGAWLNDLGTYAVCSLWAQRKSNLTQQPSPWVPVRLSRGTPIGTPTMPKPSSGCAEHGLWLERVRPLFWDQISSGLHYRRSMANYISILTSGIQIWLNRFGIAATVSCARTAQMWQVCSSTISWTRKPDWTSIQELSSVSSCVEGGTWSAIWGAKGPMSPEQVVGLLLSLRLWLTTMTAAPDGWSVSQFSVYDIGGPAGNVLPTGHQGGQ